MPTNTNKAELLKKIDSLYAAGKMKETIVVFPNTNSYKNEKDYCKSRFKKAFESLFEVNGSVESHFVDNVVYTVDSLFRTVPAKEYRAIAGLSIGALQSIHISAASPFTFDYIGLFSPMVSAPYEPGPDIDFMKHLRKRQKVQFSDPPALYWIMIGKADIFYPRMQAYTKYLRRNSYEYKYTVTSGGHRWDNWEKYCVLFMQDLW